MDAVLWKVGVKFTAKFGAHQGRVLQLWIFKELNTNKEVKMNLPIDDPIASHWLPSAQEGNVFYGLQLQGNNPKNVDYYKPFNRVEIKKGNKNASV